MIEEVLKYLNNFFACSKQDGEFIIEGGTLELETLSQGQYYLIEGSVFNDGVHEYQSFDLTDEEFSGVVYGLAIPPRLIELVDEIEEWKNSVKEVSNSPYASESFGGYSYSLKDDVQTSSWKSHFSENLKEWMKL